LDFLLELPQAAATSASTNATATSSRRLREVNGISSSRVWVSTYGWFQWRARLLRGEPQCTVETDVLAVEVRVPRDRLHQEGELLGSTHPVREHDVLDELRLQRVVDPEHGGR